MYKLLEKTVSCKHQESLISLLQKAFMCSHQQRDIPMLC